MQIQEQIKALQNLWLDLKDYVHGQQTHVSNSWN